MDTSVSDHTLDDDDDIDKMFKQNEKVDNTAQLVFLEQESKPDDHIPNDNVLSKVSIYKNLAVLSISFLLLFSAFLSLQNLQSSLNITEGLGMTGLTCVYASMIISCLLLPPLTISKLGMKWTTVLSSIAYLGYIAASFHAVWGTIIPTSIILGLGAANLWSGKMAYLTELAKHYSLRTSTDSFAATDKLFGVFYATYHTG